MLLQEIFKPENIDEERHFHVTINEGSYGVEFASPPPKLQEISFVIKLSDEDNTLNEELLNILVSYRLSKVSVIIEVPLELVSENKVDITYLLNLTHNLDVSLSLLPNGHKLCSSTPTIEDYKNSLGKVVEALTKKPNFSKLIYPVSNYLQYLMMEIIVGEEKLKSFKPEDAYVIDNFFNVMSVQDSDNFKNFIRQEIYNFYGGKNEFKMVAGTMIKTLYDKNKETYRDLVLKDMESRKQEMESQENKPPEA